MDFNEFKEQFTEDVKQELADAGIEAKVSINTVEKMNESYEAMTVTPEGSNVGVNVNIGIWKEQYEKEGFNPITQEAEKAIRNRIHVEYELPLGQEYADLVVSFIDIKS